MVIRSSEIVKNPDSFNRLIKDDPGKPIKNNVLHLLHFVRNSDTIVLTGRATCKPHPWSGEIYGEFS